MPSRNTKQYNFVHEITIVQIFLHKIQHNTTKCCKASVSTQSISSDRDHFWSSTRVSHHNWLTHMHLFSILFWIKISWYSSLFYISQWPSLKYGRLITITSLNKPFKNSTFEVKAFTPLSVLFNVFYFIIIWLEIFIIQVMLKICKSSYCLWFFLCI